MTDYSCPSCGGGFPDTGEDACPWCGESMDGGDDGPTTPGSIFDPARSAVPTTPIDGSRPRRGVDDPEDYLGALLGSTFQTGREYDLGVTTSPRGDRL